MNRLERILFYSFIAGVSMVFLAVAVIAYLAYGVEYT